MPIAVRLMRAEEARRFLEIHHAAVRHIAAKDYPPSVIEEWAPMPITDQAVEQLRANRGNEIRLIAEIDGEAVGIGALVVETSELRACYVAPDATSKGVGSALVAEIERVARENGLTYLHLDSSTTAEGFYAELGYKIEARGEHVLGSGQGMAAVKMRKSL